MMIAMVCTASIPHEKSPSEKRTSPASRIATVLSVVTAKTNTVRSEDSTSRR